MYFITIYIGNDFNNFWDWSENKQIVVQGSYGNVFLIALLITIFLKSKVKKSS